MLLLPCFKINPKTTPTGSVIWLQGLGASGHEFANVVPELHLDANLSLRFIFPHAPERAVTINQGYRMPAWYDITGFDLSSREDEVGLGQSELQIHDLIQREVNRGIDTENIILAGFSQGGATALFSGLRAAYPLKGLIVLSAYCPVVHTVTSTRSPANAKTPIFVGHGRMDDVVPHQWGMATVRFLKEWEYSVTWKDYAMPHSVCPEELRDIGQWISQRFV